MIRLRTAFEAGADKVEQLEPVGNAPFQVDVVDLVGQISDLHLYS